MFIRTNDELTHRRMKYLVFLAYYKHGETDVKVFGDEARFRAFAADYLQDHMDVEPAAFESDSAADLPLDELARVLIELGGSVILEQCGYGIVSIHAIDGTIENYW